MKLTSDLKINGFKAVGMATPTMPTDGANKAYVDSKTINKAQVTVDFGTSGDMVSVTLAAAWITPASIIVCSMALVPTSDHDIEDYFLEELKTAPGEPTNGSVDIYCFAPNGTFGQYVINVIGA